MLSLVVDLVNSCVLNLLSLLPSSPFRVYMSFRDEWNLLGVINFFIPFDLCLVILEAWLTAVISVYIYKNSKKVLNYF